MKSVVRTLPNLRTDFFKVIVLYFLLLFIEKYNFYIIFVLEKV